MEQIRVSTFAGPGAQPVIHDVPRPKISNKSALIKIACGVCGTDLHIAKRAGAKLSVTWVAQHVARGVGRYELPTYFVQRATIVALLIPGISLCRTMGSRSPISGPKRFSLSR